MTDWVRLWHDMPSDPKWRTIARRSGQRIGDVIAIFTFILVNASANASERGRTQGLDAEDIGAALDMETVDVEAVFDAMQGKVLSGEGLTGWGRRQPKREDNSASRAKQWRDERKRTQANAEERPETETESTDANASDGDAVDPTKIMFDSGVALITKYGMNERQARSWLGKALKECGAEAVLVAIGSAQRSGQQDPVPYMTAILKNGGSNARQQWQVDRDIAASHPGGTTGAAFEAAFAAMGVGGSGNIQDASERGLKQVYSNGDRSLRTELGNGDAAGVRSIAGPRSEPGGTERDERQ